MEFVELTEEQRRFFDDNGYMMVPDVLSSEEVERLTQASDRMIESCNSDGSYVPDAAGDCGGTSLPSAVGLFADCAFGCPIAVSEYSFAYYCHYL